MDPSSGHGDYPDNRDACVSKRLKSLFSAIIFACDWPVEYENYELNDPLHLLRYIYIYKNIYFQFNFFIEIKYYLITSTKDVFTFLFVTKYLSKNKL